MAIESAPPTTAVSFQLDGKDVSCEVDPELTALAVIRERFGATSPKNGCEPQGHCGCCAVLWNGKPVLSCVRSAAALDGVEIVTLEGLPDREREILSRGFVDKAGIQCGFCIPGIAVRAKALLDKNSEPTVDDVGKALGAHLCRCTGYTKIVEAVQEAGRHWHAEGPPPDPCTDPTIGQSHARYQGLGRVLGDIAYVDDLVVEGMLHGALRLSDHPRATVRSVDVSAALEMPGVEAVLTAADLPAARNVGLIVPDWAVFVGVGETTTNIGAVIAAVAATDRATARRAAAAIVVEWDVHEPLTCPHEALKDGAPRVHPDRENLAATTFVKRGDVDAALAASAHVLTETFHTQRVEHAYLEPESVLAVPEDDGGIRVHTQGQGVHDDQKQLAAVMGWDLDRIRVQLEPNGGGFGGKEDLSCHAQAVLLAHKTGKPVKVWLSRDESILLSPKRHPLDMEYTVGCDEEGRLTAVRARIVGDTGGYLSVGCKVLERAAGHSCGPYRVPAVDVEARCVYTNNPVGGAFRGFGANQVAFAIDGMLDRLGELVGLDGYDVRERNILAEGEPFATGQLMDGGVGIKQTLEACKEEYKAAKYVGISCGIKNTGIGNGMADTGRVTIEIDGPDKVTAYTGFTEMGQGLLTILRQVVCTETGLDPAIIECVVSTDRAVECGMTTASRATMLVGEAGRRAAVALKAELDAGKTLADLVGQAFEGEFICDFTCKPEEGGENPVTHVTFGYATQMVILDDEGRLEKVVAVHDVGRVMNKALCEGQVEGGIAMGLGFALTEDLQAPGGVPESTKLNDLYCLRCKHMPEIEVTLLEVPDPHTTYGVKGVGEIGLVPTAPAVAAALKRFDGIWRTRLPMRGSAAARAILPKKAREDDHA